MFSPAGPKRVLIHELSRANTSKLGSKCDIKQLLKKNVASLRIQPQESGRRKRRDQSDGGFLLLAGSENDQHVRVLNKHRINYPSQNTCFTSCVKQEIRILMLFENEWISNACKKERLLQYFWHRYIAIDKTEKNSSRFKKLKNINCDIKIKLLIYSQAQCCFILLLLPFK